MLSNTVKQLIVFSQLILIMLSAFGLTNLPGSLQFYILKDFKIDASEYGLMVSVCNWAALIDVLHGYLLDRYLGIKFASFLYSSLVVVGSIIFSIAGYTRSFPLLLLGRTIIGFGVNPIMLCTNKHIIFWFSRGRFINLVYSVNESILWLGSSACYFVSVNLLKYIEHYRTPPDSLAVTLCSETVTLCFLSVVPTIVLAFMYGDNEFDKKNSNENWQGNHIDKGKEMTWKDYISMPVLFWIFSITVFIYFISILTFLSMSQVFFEQTYNLSTTYASNLSGSITILAFIMSPPFGYFLDRFGHNLTCLTGAFVLNIISHGIFAFTDLNPLIPVSVMAVSIVLSSSLWSQFQYLVAEHQYMIAYGVAQTGLNGALAVGTLIAGYIIDNYGYDGFMTSLFSLIICTIPGLILIWVLNYKRGNVLNINPRKKMEYLGRAVDMK